jgi:flagellum-specific ATP synthase
VEGDDTNEPVSDAVRSILDGHILLDRDIAERGRYPAVNVLRSVSRTMPDCNTPEETELITQARRYMATYADMEELIRLGAYRKGTNPEVDAAIFYNDMLEQFLAQDKNERESLAGGYEKLSSILSTPMEG